MYEYLSKSFPVFLSYPPLNGLVCIIEYETELKTMFKANFLLILFN